MKTGHIVLVIALGIAAFWSYGQYQDYPKEQQRIETSKLEARARLAKNFAEMERITEANKQRVEFMVANGCQYRKHPDGDHYICPVTLSLSNCFLTESDQRLKSCLSRTE